MSEGFSPADLHRRRDLEARPESARAARSAVAEVLREAGRHDLVETAELLVSELVTNAVVHARTAIVLDIVAGSSGVRVAVQDGSPHLPSLRHYGRAATTGRGLELIEMMADRHGTASVSGGKVVWFELGSPGPTAFGGKAGASWTGVTGAVVDVGVVVAPDVSAGPIRVEFLDVPMVLARAWCHHTGTLLREHRLQQLDAVHGKFGARTEDGAYDAFAVLADAVGAVPAAALTGRDVAIYVTPSDAPGYAALSELMDDVLVAAESGQTLAPPVQPELRLLRRWLCDEVCRQVDGGAPTPWPGLPDDLVSPEGRPPRWPLHHVRDAVVAVVAADDVNRILAVSRPAMDLLGWDDSLVGRRLVTLIPESLRAAHIAGFTVHLLTGDTVILGTEVEVPALRRDGSQLPVKLLVRRESSLDGHPVFIATMRPAVVPG